MASLHLSGIYTVLSSDHGIAHTSYSPQHHHHNCCSVMNPNHTDLQAPIPVPVHFESGLEPSTLYCEHPTNCELSCGKKFLQKQEVGLCAKCQKLSTLKAGTPEFDNIVVSSALLRFSGRYHQLTMVSIQMVMQCRGCGKCSPLFRTDLCGRCEDICTLL